MEFSMSVRLLAALCLLPLTACFDQSDPLSPPPRRQVEVPQYEPEDRAWEEPDETPPVEEEPARPSFESLTCLPSEEQRAIGRIRQVAEASVHELVTCGGAQLNLINGMVARILFSNPEFFDADTIEDLKALMGLSDVPFERLADGRWRMPINDQSAFDMAFFLPEAQTPATADVLDLEAYLTGARITTSLSFDEMMDNPTAVNEYMLTWTGYGPLGHLMFPEGERPDPQIAIIHASLWDFANLLLDLGEPVADFGPFARLVDLEVHSDVKLIDRRDGIDVAYTFDAPRAPLHVFHDRQSVAFELHGLAATDGRVTLQGAAADLTVLGRGTLAGVLIYAVDGISVDDVRVVDDFGNGAGYPEASYWCPDDWATAPYSL
jgi:hypothetical protein